MSPIAYRWGTFVRIRPSTLMKPRSSSAFVDSRPISSTFGARPVATSSSSAETSAASLPSGPTVSLTPSLPAFTDSTSKRAFVMTVMPRRVKLRSRSWLTSRSSAGTSAGRYSRSVTLTPEVVVHRGELDADRPGADDDHVLRQAVGDEDLVRGHDPLPVGHEARQRLHARAGREDDVRRLEDALAPAAGRPVLAVHLDPDGGGAVEAAATRDPGHLVLVDEGLEARPHPLHDLVAAGGHPRVVDDRVAGKVDAEVLGVPDPLGEGGQFEEGLGGDAASMEAGPADLVLVHERDLEAELGGPEGRRVAAGPRAEDDEIEIVGRADGHGQAVSETVRDRSAPAAFGRARAARRGGWVIGADGTRGVPRRRNRARPGVTRPTRSRPRFRTSGSM